MIKALLAESTIPLPTKASLKTMGDFYFRLVGEKYLITNDWGYYAQLTAAQFKDFVGGSLREDSALWKELKEKGFLRKHLNLKDLASKFTGHNAYLWKGPSLHIVVVTLRCNLKCVYCHSSVVGQNQLEFDMTVDTARKAVDFIFESPNPSLMIEFQGGEPLLNWETVLFICRYAKEKAEREKRKVQLTMVSNFTLLNDEKLKILTGLGVSVCTSMDGPAQVHDHNRIYLGGNSHKDVTYWIEKIIKAGLPTGALMTATRRSLEHPREIVDEYARVGLKEIFLRPLHYLGFAKRSWAAIGYRDEEFVAFYRKAMDYILEKNLKGEFFRESTAALLLNKILLHKDPGYVDLRSPCGATLGQVSYNYNGEIYTCDEGRMLAAEGDKLFKIGDLSRDGYNDIVDHPTTKACCVASTTDSQPLCNSCAYKPYCGICPVLNQAVQNSIWGQMPTNSYCYLFMHIFDYLFEKLGRPETRRVLESWVGLKDSVIAPGCVGKL